jgi:hypothetical protein
LEPASDPPRIPELQEIKELPFREVADDLRRAVFFKEPLDGFGHFEELEGPPDPERGLAEEPLQGRGAPESPGLHQAGIEAGPLEGGRSVEVVLVLLPDLLVQAADAVQDLGLPAQDELLAAVGPAGIAGRRSPEGTPFRGPELFRRECPKGHQLSCR